MPGLLERLRTQFGGAPAGGTLLDRLRAQDDGEEQRFRSWYGERASRQGLDPNPDSPEHFYDYRAAFRAGAEPDETGHWPSEFKLKGHPRTYLEDDQGWFDTRTGERFPGMPLDEFKARSSEEWEPPEPEPPIVAYDALSKLGKRWALGAPAESIAGIARLGARYNPNQLLARGLGIPGAEDAVEAVDRTTEPLARFGGSTLSETDAALQRAGAPTLVRTGTLLAAEVLGPEELAPGGAFYKALRGVKPVARAATSVTPDIAELAARSLAIGEPETLAPKILETTPSPLPRFSPPVGERLKTIAAQAPDGSEAGYIRVLPEEGGYRVDDIRVAPEFRRQGIGTALHKEAEKLYGPRVGPTVGSTPQGDSLAQSLVRKKSLDDVRSAAKRAEKVAARNDPGPPRERVPFPEYLVEDLARGDVPVYRIQHSGDLSETRGGKYYWIDDGAGPHRAASQGEEILVDRISVNNPLTLVSRGTDEASERIIRDHLPLEAGLLLRSVVDDWRFIRSAPGGMIEKLERLGVSRTESMAAFDDILRSTSGSDLIEAGYAARFRLQDLVANAWARKQGYDSIVLHNSSTGRGTLVDLRANPAARMQQESLSSPSARAADQKLVAPRTSEAGFVEAGSAGGVIQNFFRRYFTWHGQMAPLGKELAPVAAEARVAARGLQAEQMFHAERNLADLEVAMKDFLAQKAPDWSPDDAIDYVSKYMTGQNQGDELTGGLRATATSMREHVDVLTAQLQAEPGLISENLKAVLGENMGSYLRREYQNFVNPAWRELVSPGGAERWRWDKAKDFLVANRGTEGGFQYFDPVGESKRFQWRLGTDKLQSSLEEVAQGRVDRIEPMIADRGMELETDLAERIVKIQEKAATAKEGSAAQLKALDRIKAAQAEGLGSIETTLLNMRANLETLAQGAQDRIPKMMEQRAMELRRSEEFLSREFLPEPLLAQVESGAIKTKEAVALHRANLTERWLNQAVNRDTDAFMGIGGGLGRLDLGIFKARKEIPEAIEDYLGLIKEPEKRYAASVHRMAHDLATHQMLTKMRDAGLGRIFFDDKIHGAMPNHFVEIPGGANRHPLAGLKTSPEIADVVRGIGERAKDYAPWLRAYMVANSGTKIGKTALSVQSHARNMLSWGAFLMSNGHFGSLPIAQLPTSGAARQAWQALSLGKKVVKGGEVEKLLSKVVDRVTLIDGQKLALPEGIDAMRDLVGKGHRFGVFGESANASDLAHHLGVAKSAVGDRARRAAAQLSESGLPGRAIVATGRGGKKALQAGLAAYGAEDDFGKLIAWMAETRNYMKAYKQEIAAGAMSTDDVLKLTSRIVRDTTPTQSLASPAVRALRDFPLIADFPTFYGEIFRNAKNIVKQGFQELGSANPAIKKIGAQRLAGFTATLAVPMAVPTALALKAGVTQDQQEAIREHLPEYMRDGHFGVWSADHQAKKYEAFDFSFMFPYTVLTEPAMAVLGQGKWDEATWDERLAGAVAQSTEPFWGRSILAGTAFDIARGETSTGRAVRNKVEDLGPQVRDSLAYAAQQLQPGTATTAGKILQAAGVTHNPYGRRLPTELLAVMGPRVIPIQVLSTEGRPGTIFYRARSVSEAVDGARTIYYQARRAPAPERDQARARANAAWRKTWDETERFLESLEVLGVKPSATERELKDGGLPAWMIESLLARKFVPLTFKEDR